MHYDNYDSSIVINLRELNWINWEQSWESQFAYIKGRVNMQISDQFISNLNSKEMSQKDRLIF